MANDQVTKVYELRTIGYDRISSELNDINQQFIQIRKSKLDLAKTPSSVEDPAQLDAIKKKLQDLQVEEANLKVRKLELTNEAKAANIVRQQEIDQQKAVAAGAKTAAGSYNELYQQYKQLYALVKAAPAGSPVTFQGSTLGYDQAISKLKELASAEQAFRRQFAGDGVLIGEYTSGIVNAFKNLGLDDLIGGQITKAQSRLTELNTSFTTLREELSQIGVNGAGGFELIEKELIANRNEALQLQTQLATLQTEFRGTGDVGNQITSSLGEGFKSVKNQIGQLLIGYFGFQAAFQGIIGGVETTKELADQTTNLQIELGTTTERTTSLVNELAKLDTRTKLTVLEDIANIAAKAGVGEQQLVGVTQAIDKIKTAFGKDFGDVEQGTESLVKIVNIFQGTDQVTGDNLLKVGNAIRTLANESVASVPFINDFTKRMAGLKGISDISLPAVLGLASGFEQFGQTAEVSSTALVRIIPKIAANTEKFAQVAGLTQEAFSKLLNTNPAEALLQVSQGFLQGKSSLEEFEASFKDSGLGSGRVSSVIGVLGKNTDAFRKSIASAGESFSNTTNIETAFTAKNQNLAASLDKISKSFSDAAGSKLFQISVSAIASAVALLIGLLPALITLVAVLGTAWLVANADVVLLNASMAFYNLMILRNQALMLILRTATLLNAAAMAVLNGAIALTTKGFELMGVAIKSTPFGIIVTILGTLAGLFIGLSHALAESTSQLALQNIQLRIAKDVHQEATAAIADQMAKVQGLTAVVKDLAISESTRLKALQDLIAINPEFSAALKGNKIDLDALNKATTDYNANLLKTAELQAAQNRQQKEFSDLVQLQNTKQGLEIAQAQGKGFGDLTDQERGAFSKITTSVGRSAFTSDLINASISKSDFDEAFKALDAQIKQQQVNIDAANGVLKQKYAAVNTTIKEGQAAINATNATKPRTVQFLEDQLKALDAQIEQTEIGTQRLKDLVKQRSDLQDELDRALGQNKGGAYRGAKLTGDQRDALKNVDADRDEQLAEENLLHQQGLDNEANYLRNVLDINQAAIDKKLTLIKGANAEERKIISELQLERITLEQDTNQKIFEARERAIKNELDQQVKEAQEVSRKIQDDPNAAPTVKSQAKLDSDQTILAAQQKSYNELLALEKQYNISATALNKELFDQIHKTQVDITNDTRANALARIDDIKQAASNVEAQFNSVIDRNEARIQANNALSQIDKDDQIREQENDRKVGLLAIQAAEYKLLADEFKKDYDKGLITLAEYQLTVDKLQQLQNQVATAPIKPGTGKADNTGTLKDVKDIQGLTTLGIDKVFDIDKDSNAGKAVSKGVVDAYSTMQSAMTSFFNAEDARIKANLKLKEDQLDAEEKQVEARAQSQAEIQSIENQYAEKKKKAEADALAKEKKVKRAQAALAFATELANIWSSAAELGPIAGPILGVIEAGLALVRYEQTISTINSQTAARGISIGPDGSTTRGGVVKGRPHSKGGNPFLFKGRVFEDEVDELNVIRTKDVPGNKKYHISGNHTQIASALNELGGGDRFASGAHVMRLATGGSIQRFDNGGALGESLQPPVFTPSGPGAGADISSLSKQFDQMNANMVRLAEEQSKRIDRLEVVQDTATVTTAQKKRVKQSKIASL